MSKVALATPLCVPRHIRKALGSEWSGKLVGVGLEVARLDTLYEPDDTIENWSKIIQGAGGLVVATRVDAEGWGLPLDGDLIDQMILARNAGITVFTQVDFLDVYGNYGWRPQTPGTLFDQNNWGQEMIAELNTTPIDGNAQLIADTLARQGEQ